MVDKSVEDVPLQSHRAALLLAASGLNDRALRDFVKFVIEAGPEASVAFIRSLRQRVPANLESFVLAGHLGDLERPAERVALEVLRLLLHESGLSADQAAKLLTDSIRRTHSETTKLPPFRGKEGFAQWLKKLNKSVSASELLHHATRIRNDAVHSISSSDWPLRTRTKK